MIGAVEKGHKIARKSARLLFRSERYWPPGNNEQNTAAINESIKICLGEVRSRLDEAARSVAEGIDVSMDIEQLIYEAGRLHDAISLMHRLTGT